MSFLTVYASCKVMLDHLKKSGLTINSSLEEAKEKMLWGTYGKPKKKRVKWVKLKSCSTEHLQAIVKTQYQIDQVFKTIVQSILQDRLNTATQLFKVSTCCHGTPAIELHDASKDLHSFLRAVVCNNWINDEEYKVSKASGAFLQGGSNLEEGWILIEFWRPEGVQQFVNFITQAWYNRLFG